MYPQISRAKVTTQLLSRLPQGPSNPNHIQLVAPTTTTWVPDLMGVDMAREKPKPQGVLPHTVPPKGLKRHRESDPRDAPTLCKRHQLPQDTHMPWESVFRLQEEHGPGAWSHVQAHYDAKREALDREIHAQFEGGVLVPVPGTQGHKSGGSSVPLQVGVHTTVAGQRLVLKKTQGRDGEVVEAEDLHVVYGTSDIRACKGDRETLQSVAVAIKALHAKNRERDFRRRKGLLTPEERREEGEALRGEEAEEEEEAGAGAHTGKKRPLGDEAGTGGKKRQRFVEVVDPFYFKKIENEAYTEEHARRDREFAEKHQVALKEVSIPVLETCCIEPKIATLEQLKGMWSGFMQTLYSIPMARGFDSFYPQQEKMLKAMCSTLAMAIFDKHYADALPWLVGTFGLRHAKFVTGVVASRQVGKTTLAAALMVAAMVNFGKLQMGIASTGQRASINVLAVVKEFLRSLEAHLGGTFSMDNNQRMKIVLDNGSAITALPMSVDTNRGIPYDVVYADEAAFIKLEMLAKVLIPLLVRPGRCLFMTSTPHTDPANHFTKMLTMYQGTMIDVVVLSLVCDACAAIPGFQGTCPHRQGLLSEDVKSSRSKLTELILKSISDEATLQTELQGRPSTQTCCAFPPDAIRDIQDAEAVQPVFPAPDCKPEYMFMCIDPTGGGPSDLAIVMGYGVRVAGKPHPLTIVRAFQGYFGKGEGGREKGEGGRGKGEGGRGQQKHYSMTL